MQAKALFKYSRALDDEPAYRNINYPSGSDAFKDLLDPEDASDDATLPALQKANRMRSTVGAFAALDQTSFLNIAILRVFQRAVFFPTRYGDGSFPVWYGCMDPLTAIYETAFHMIREERNLENHRHDIKRSRLVFKVACNSILIDLTRDRRFFPRLTDPNNYRFTQQVGKRIRIEQHPGLLSPSARQQDGINLAIFNSACLSSPELVEKLIYQFNPESMRVDVLREDRILTTIDGRIWADGFGR